MKHSIKATVYDKRGRKLASAFNSYTKTHPLQSHFAKLEHQNDRTFLHAEIRALLRAKDKPVYSIFVERYGADGKPRDAAPCAICRRALDAYGVRRIDYTIGGT